MTGPVGHSMSPHTLLDLFHGLHAEILGHLNTNYGNMIPSPHMHPLHRLLSGFRPFIRPQAMFSEPELPEMDAMDRIAAAVAPKITCLKDILDFCFDVKGKPTFVGSLVCLYHSKEKLEPKCLSLIGGTDIFVCAESAMDHCPDAKNPFVLHDCLVKHSDVVSQECREKLVKDGAISPSAPVKTVESAEHSEKTEAETLTTPLVALEKGSVPMIPLHQTTHPLAKFWVVKIWIFGFLALSIGLIVAILCYKNRPSRKPRLMAHIGAPEATTTLLE